MVLSRALSRCSARILGNEVYNPLRFHPNTSGKRALGTNTHEAHLQDELSVQAPDNIRVVRSESDISSFDLLALSTAGMVWHSTVGLEIAALGKPVLRLGAYWFRDADFMDTLDRSEALSDAVDRVLAPRPETDRADRIITA